MFLPRRVSIVCYYHEWWSPVCLLVFLHCVFWTVPRLSQCFGINCLRISLCHCRAECILVIVDEHSLCNRFRFESGKRVDSHRMINCIDTECLGHYFSQLDICRMCISLARLRGMILLIIRIGEDKIFGQIEKLTSEGCRII